MPAKLLRSLLDLLGALENETPFLLDSQDVLGRDELGREKMGVRLGGGDVQWECLEEGRQRRGGDGQGGERRLGEDGAVG
jgi:hypothetical protein